MLTKVALWVALRGAAAITGAYLLNDTFTIERAPGAVGGTAAEPGPGVRTVVDTNNKLSMVSGQASFATGGLTNGDPRLTWDATDRKPGRLLVIQQQGSSGASTWVGWHQTPNNFPQQAALRYSPTTTLIYYDGASLITVGTYVVGTTYQVAIPLRAAGGFCFVKGGIYTNWTLIYGGVGNAATPMYPNISSSAAGVMTVDYIRVPAALWLPTPLISDGFSGSTSDGLGHAEGVAGGLGAGGSGVAWTGATWAVSGGVLKNTPTLGSELISNGNFASDTVWSKGTGWTIAAGVATKAPGAASQLTQNILTTGLWYRADWEITAYTAGTFAPMFGAIGAAKAAIGTYSDTGRATAAQAGARAVNTTSDGSVDNISYKALTLSTLFRTSDLTKADVFASVAVTLTAGTQAGLVINLDSTGSPANFVIIYHNGTQVVADKCVAGTYTNLIASTVTYVAGATLTVQRRGNALRVYYNNALVGTEQTVSDAGIVSNTRHGTFSTYALNEFDNLVIYATGSGGEFAVLDSY